MTSGGKPLRSRRQHAQQFNLELLSARPALDRGSLLGHLHLALVCDWNLPAAVIMIGQERDMAANYPY